MTASTTALGDKIRSHHRDRLAVVYVRQSTLQQVERHHESTRLQYDLVDRAQLLGWARERIAVIDEDLGRSGASAEGRPGFQRLVADVGLGRVGLVLGVEMSRLARSCRDWYQLLEICALRGTLIGDADGICDPGTYNDRLLLGLKGTLSEAELHLLKTRMHDGRRAKAQRGDLPLSLPRGYLRCPDGSVMLDPDDQVQATIRLVFALFERSGTISGVLRHLVAHDLCLPDRLRSGAGKGELAWRRPNRATLVDMLHNPAYAGVYVFGRRAVDPSRRQPGRPATGRRRGDDLEADGVVVLRDRMPAYISWDQYLRNQERMAANRSQHLGVPRPGPALLSGLLVCGRCGHRMFTTYNNNGRDLRYFCGVARASYGAPVCQSLSGRILDRHIAELVLQAIQPAALEASLQLVEDLELERTEQHRQWRLRLERARYEADRARRQYAAVEPENRLVARTLERQWEAALATEHHLQAAYDRLQAQEPIPPTATEQEAIRRLAADVPALWAAPTTTVADRQALVRLVLARIVVTVAGTTEAVTVDAYWAGGARTRTQIRRPVELAQLSTYEALVARVAELHQVGHLQATIATILNAEGWQPAKRRASFTRGMVGDLLRQQGLASRRHLALAERVARQADEMTIVELAGRLSMPHQTLFAWLRRGLLKARRTSVCGHRMWLIRADDAEIERLKLLRQLPRRQPSARSSPQ